MNTEDKELLSKDLCARLPYGVKYNYGGYDGCDYTMGKVSLTVVDDFPIENVKPYLFPLESITEEQKEDMIKSSCGIGSDKNVFDWYNKNHFDYRGLIEKGLALDATGLNIY